MNRQNVETAGASHPRPDALSASVPAARPDLIYAVVAAAAVLFSFAFLFSEFLRTQWNFAIRHQADWGHTLIIPLIAAYFVYLRLDKIKEVGLKTTWIGLVPVVIGSFLYMFFWMGPEALRHFNLQGAAVSIAIFGIVLTFAGFRAMRYLWFPTLFLCIFGQAISHGLMARFTAQLQDIAAVGSYYLMLVLGFTIERTGNVLVVFDDGEEKPLNIAEACSGMRMLMAFLALGVFIAYTTLSRFWQQALLVLMAFPVAIFVNVLRVVTLGWLSLYDTNFAAGDFHHFVGLVWLVPALLIYLGIVWILRNLIIEPSEGD